jgi:hypothetical protein
LAILILRLKENNSKNYPLPWREGIHPVKWKT